MTKKPNLRVVEGDGFTPLPPALLEQLAPIQQALQEAQRAANQRSALVLQGFVAGLQMDHDAEHVQIDMRRKPPGYKIVPKEPAPPGA